VRTTDETSAHQRCDNENSDMPSHGCPDYWVLWSNTRGKL
jgi:hypothetical protein